MAHRKEIVTIFGGTGFLGKQIVGDLARRGFIIKIATRIPESAYSLKPYGEVGQIVPIECNYLDASSIRAAVKGSDFAVNCVGILFERGKRSRFARVHIDIPAMIAKACADEQVKRFVHISALGCDKATSKYGKSKLAGEAAILSNYPAATILRPSVIFGENDNFFNMFAELSRFTPFLPLIGGGKTKFQPVYVGDVADIVVKALTSNMNKYLGSIYELGGADIVTFKEIYEKLFEYTGRRRRLIHVPYWAAKIQAVFLSLLPKPIFTPDQVESLKTDNIVSEGAKNMQSFDIMPKSMDLILPKYLKNYKAGGRFAWA